MKPMLAQTTNAARLTECLADRDWFLQQKLDGDRILIHVLDGDVRALNRNGDLRRNSVPRMVLDQFRGLSGEWCFDGELLDELWVFDLPRAGSVVGPGSTLEFRLDALAMVARRAEFDPRWVRMLPTARTNDDKLKLARQVIDQGGEGVVLKHRSGRYQPGARSEQMLKFKLWNTADVVVSGVRLDGRNNCEYSLLDGDRWVTVGSCTLEGKGDVRIGDVVEVKYLYASSDRKLYQPSLVKVRDDKPAEQCTIDQLVFTDRSVVEFTPQRVMPYIRQQRRSRAAGSMVSIFDAAHPESVFNPAFGGRWVTYCEDHGAFCQYRSLRLARNYAPVPQVWCSNCKTALGEAAS